MQVRRLGERREPAPDVCILRDAHAGLLLMIMILIRSNTVSNIVT